MPSINITVLSVQVTTVPTAKSSYQVADVAYKNNTFQGKVEGKKVMSFGATANAFKTLADGAQGKTFNVEYLKNEKGYNDWLSLSEPGQATAYQTGAVGGSVPQQVSSPISGRGAATPAARSTYETPEERAKRQVYIVRQSSAATAERLLSVGAKTPVSVDTLIETAKKIESYIFATGGATGFDDVPDFPPEFEQQPEIK